MRGGRGNGYSGEMKGMKHGRRERELIPPHELE